MQNNPAKWEIWQQANLVFLQGTSRSLGAHTIKFWRKKLRNPNCEGCKLQETLCSSQTQQYAGHKLHWAGHTWFLFLVYLLPNCKTTGIKNTEAGAPGNTYTYPHGQSKTQTVLNFLSQVMPRSDYESKFTVLNVNTAYGNLKFSYIHLTVALESWLAGVYLNRLFSAKATVTRMLFLHLVNKWGLAGLFIFLNFYFWNISFWRQMVLKTCVVFHFCD